MASPDISRYVDLKIYDLQPSDIYDAAVQYANTALPEWTPVPGSVEDAVLQANAFMTGQLVGAINRLPSGLMEGLLRLYGIERSSGSAPTGTALVTFIDFDGYTLPAGTRLGFVERSGNDSILYAFETTETVTVGAGVNTIIVPIRGLAFQQYPNLTDGENLQLLSAVSYVDEVSLQGDLSSGADAETDEEFLNRASLVLGRLSEAVALPSQMERYALTDFANVYRSKAYSRIRCDASLTALSRSEGEVTATLAESTTLEVGDSVLLLGSIPEESDPPLASFDGVFTVETVDELGNIITWLQDEEDGESSATGTLFGIKLQDLYRDSGSDELEPQNGFVTVIASAIGGNPLTSQTLDALRNNLSEKAVVGLLIATLNAQVVDLEIDVRVVKQRVAAASVVEQDIIQALENYVHPDYWPWEDKVYKNEIIALVDRVPGVVRVVDVTITPDEIYLESTEEGDARIRYAGILPRSITTVTVE